MKVVHWVMVGAGALSAVATAVAQFAPGTWGAALHGVAAGGVALATYLGLVSDKGIGGGS